MSDNTNMNLNTNESGEEQQPMSLDDGRRVKVLSPGMMVFKRFIRNKLAIVGICILVFMFLFSFLGGVISPYRQDQVFHKYDKANKEYAGAVVNTDYRFTAAEGFTLTTMTRANFNSKVKGSEEAEVKFEADDVTYLARKVDDNFYTLSVGEQLGTVTVLGKITDIKSIGDAELSKALKDAATAAVKASATSFEAEGVTYTLTKGAAKSYVINGMKEVAMVSMLNFDAFTSEYDTLARSFAFRKACETAMHAGADSFEVDGTTYRLDIEDETNAVAYLGDTEVVNISNIIVNPVNNGVFLSIDYKAAVAEAIAEKHTTFDFVDENGETVKNTVTMRNNNYVIFTEQATDLIDMYAPPSKEHWLGTDDHGMDVLTRLMYGGRISLMVGFIVMILENLIGIVIGGISGYFGGWVDTMLMRFVDLFNSIPYYPMMIIAGAIMDSFEVNPYVRLYMMMAIMGIMGWTGVARVVRGQILSLREQDFMVATEATGIAVSRRIFRHLVPNVMPLLIVQATMGLGGIILTEATLSFLGLGIKYPLASWGSIINAASNIYVMTYCWFIWIPAGLLIVLTVLGFNFVGDGLRDAFDPKMKR
ncbi:MAG: ABC transporter permease [Lachnospiraceae bacterium]|nr:ABC transporter permease [Lachnospiraceae bacterium]MBR4210725.1 ABC transporter permease [Lachnospiraceae bacterium]